MNYAVEKFKILDTFLKNIQQLDNNYFELSKDEIDNYNSSSSISGCPKPNISISYLILLFSYE